MISKFKHNIMVLSMAGLLPLIMSCGDSQFANYSQSELQDAYSDCENRDSMSPGAAITCDNIRRECDDRAKEKGRKVCF
ncbi:MAG: hypothetical protein MI976_08235 [Pseudomonadales bacterium]|nr:hypothetical protein [Pseudomonadales bacterium]